MSSDDHDDGTVGGGEETETMQMKIQRQSSSEMLAGHEADEAMLKPLKFAACIVHRPCLLYCGVFIFLIVIIMIDGLVFEVSDNSTRAILVENDRYTIGYDSLILAADEIAKDDSSETTDAYPQTDRDNFLTYHFMFKLASYKGDLDVKKPSNTDYWILTPDNIKIILKYEDKIVADHEWKMRFCYAGDSPLDTNYSCTYNNFDYGIASPARYIAEYYDYDYEIMNLTEIQDMVLEQIADPDSYWTQYFNPSVNETGQCYLYRSFLFSGGPIGNTDYDDWEIDNATGTLVHESEYASGSEKIEEQWSEFIEWGTPFFEELVAEKDGKLSEGDLNLLVFSWAIWNDYWMVLLSDSMVFLILSILTVLTYMTIHTQSFFLSSLALFQILMSFPLAYFVYRLIYQIPHYDTLSSLIIFVLLGVGADDVFVFTDAWLQSVHFVRDSNSLEERMTFAFRRASKAMLVTQITTFFAFLATATSSLMPIAAFGIWASTIIAVNYCLVITMYPAVLVIHHKWVKKWEHPCLCFCCNKCCCSKSDDSKSAVDQSNPDDDAVDLDVERAQPPPISRLKSVEEQAVQYRWFEKFLGVHFAARIIQFRRYTLALFCVILCIGSWGASTMEAQSEEEAFFDSSHYMQRAYDMSGDFAASDSDALVEVLISFGIKGVNRDGTNRWDPEDYGKIEWDKNFDMSSVKAQNYLKQICSDLADSSLAYNSEDNVFCPITDFESYLNSTNQTFPFSSNDSSNQKQDFAVEFYAFLNSVYGSSTKGQSLSFVEYDSKEDEYIVRFMAYQVTSTLGWDVNADDSWDVLDEWNDYIKEISDDGNNGDCPEDTFCNSVNQVSLRWCWLVTQQAFVTSAIQGILIALPMAFVILLLSTRNWLVSLFAVLDIVGIMVCELSIMAAQGWNFGITECVSVVIIIGFSVDYVVHLANSYLESTAEKRAERLSFALLTIGVSVVSGAVTTFGSGFFLIFSDLVFFRKMGILMMTTIIISLFFAMFFFTSLLAEWGPQGDFASIDVYIKWIIGKCKRGDDGDNDGKDNADKQEIEMR